MQHPLDSLAAALRVRPPGGPRRARRGGVQRRRQRPLDAQDLRPDPAARQSAHQRGAAEQGEPSQARHDRARHRPHDHRPGNPLLHHRRGQRGRTLGELRQHPRQRAPARRARRADGQESGYGRLAELAAAGTVQQRVGRTEAERRRHRPRAARAVRRSVRRRPRGRRRQGGADDRSRLLRLPASWPRSRTSEIPIDARLPAGGAMAPPVGMEGRCHRYTAQSAGCSCWPRRSPPEAQSPARPSRRRADRP